MTETNPAWGKRGLREVWRGESPRDGATFILLGDREPDSKALNEVLYMLSSRAREMARMERKTRP